MEKEDSNGCSSNMEPSVKICHVDQRSYPFVNAMGTDIWNCDFEDG